MPFGAGAKSAYLTPAIETLLQRLEQMTSVHASGMIYGPNGVGKSYLMDRFLDQLDDKRYLGVALSHSTLAGSGLLRMLSLVLPGYFVHLFYVIFSLDVCFVFVCKAAKTATVRFGPKTNVFGFDCRRFRCSRRPLYEHPI